MPPQDNKRIENSISLLKIDIENAIKEHRHDGNSAQQINYPDIFDLPVQYLQAEVVEPTTDTTTGDGKHYFHIPKGMDGLTLVEVHIEVVTAGTTGTLDVQIANVTQSVDMLSTKITIDSGETGSDTGAIPVVINESNDEIFENDVIRVDVDAVHTTKAKGLFITLGFK